MKNKRKGIILAASVLGTLAVASTGFAAFVITADAGAEKTGNIDVATFEDKSHVVTVTLTNDKVAYAPLAAKSDSNQNGYDYSKKGVWLTNGGTDSDLTESLTVGVHIEVTNYTSLNSLSATLTVVNGLDAWTKAVESKYVAELPATTGITKDALVAKTGETTTGELNLTLEFKWGEKFNGENPIEYFNKTPLPDSEVNDNGAFAAKLAEARAVTTDPVYAALADADISYLLKITTN